MACVRVPPPRARPPPVPSPHTFDPDGFRQKTHPSSPLPSLTPVRFRTRSKRDVRPGSFRVRLGTSVGFEPGDGQGFDSPCGSETDPRPWKRTKDPRKEEKKTKRAEEGGRRPPYPLREMGKGDESGADNAIERRGPWGRMLTRPLRQTKAAPRSSSQRSGGPDPSTSDDHTSEDPTPISQRRASDVSGRRRRTYPRARKGRWRGDATFLSNPIQSGRGARRRRRARVGSIDAGKRVPWNTTA